MSPQAQTVGDSRGCARGTSASRVGCSVLADVRFRTGLAPFSLPVLQRVKLWVVEVFLFISFLISLIFFSLFSKGEIGFAALLFRQLYSNLATKPINEVTLTRSFLRYIRVSKNAVQLKTDINQD